MAGKTDTFYDGQYLYWYGVGNYTYEATSGMKGHQKAAEQTKSDTGPIPEGLYSFSIKLAGSARVVNVAQGKLDTKEGIQNLENMPGNDGQFYEAPEWGKNRVRLTLIQLFNSKARHRGGFYIHDSQKGYTHGCIEVDPAFFVKLRQYATDQAALKNGKKRMTLKVKYASASASTYGSTDVP
jgi:hypothetical protein